MAIFSRYSSGPQSSDSLRARKGALRSMRGSLSTRGAAQPQAPAPAMNVDDRRTAVQQLRAQKGGAAPGVQPQAPTTPARTSTINAAQPSGRSGPQAFPGGSPPPLDAPSTQRPDLSGAADELAAKNKGKADLAAAVEAERVRREEATARNTVPSVDPQVPGILDPVPPNPFNLDDVRAQQELDVKNTEQEWMARLAAARADAENRAALGGMGLSGAASALVSDTEMQGAREKSQAISELRKGQRQELVQTAIDRANLIDAEAAIGEDLDGDGKIASGDPGDNPDKVKVVDDIVNNVPSLDYGFGDPDTEPGSRYEPLVITPEQLEQLKGAGLSMTEIPSIEVNGQTLAMYGDGDGRFFVLRRF